MIEDKAGSYGIPEVAMKAVNRLRVKQGGPRKSLYHATILVKALSARQGLNEMRHKRAGAAKRCNVIRTFSGNAFAMQNFFFILPGGWR
jgi:hypothetical protein